jgi:hypothetical protein
MMSEGKAHFSKGGYPSKIKATSTSFCRNEPLDSDREGQAEPPKTTIYGCSLIEMQPMADTRRSVLQIELQKVYAGREG